MQKQICTKGQGASPPRQAEGKPCFPLLSWTTSALLDMQKPPITAQEHHSQHCEGLPGQPLRQLEQAKQHRAHLWSWKCEGRLGHFRRISSLSWGCCSRRPRSSDQHSPTTGPELGREKPDPAAWAGWRPGPSPGQFLHHEIRSWEQHEHSIPPNAGRAGGASSSTTGAEPGRSAWIRTPK